MRLLTILYAFALFLWLQVEDNTVLPVTLFGVGLAALAAFYALRGRVNLRALPPRLLVPGAALVGASIGVGAALATVGLMLLKTGLHSHLYPDYPPAHMLALLARAPVWALAGALAGLGLALAWLGIGKQKDHAQAHRLEDSEKNRDGGTTTSR